VTNQASDSREIAALRAYFDRVMQPVPEKYRLARLPVPFTSACRMDPEKHRELQTKLKELLTRTPMQGIVFYGRSGVGKTTYMAAVYAQAARRMAGQFQQRCGGSVHLMWTDFGQWQQQTNDAKFGRGNLPEINPENLRKFKAMGRTPCAFIDEFDKVSDREYMAQHVDPLMRALYDHECRLVATTNLTRQEFIERFDIHISRRVDEMCVHIEL
jgi:predicted ATPase